MAVQGTPLVLPYEHPATPPESVEAIPVGDLNEPYVQEFAPSGVVGNPIANRFPTPPSAVGFLIDLNYQIEDGVFIYPIVGLSAPYIITGAVLPEGGFLEPTLGQIWPRIG